VRRFDELDSTNRWLLDEAADGAAEGLVAVADHQTAGRGRLGRSWVAPPGASLLLSVLLRPALPVDRLHLTTASVAMAAVDACAAVAGVAAELKWPNDLLVGDRKLAGVLAESRLPAVVVGIGINVNWPNDLPDELAAIATALNREAGRPVDREALLSGLLDAIDTDWQRVADRYAGMVATVGRSVRVELAGETVTGVAVAVTPAGYLLVAPDGGGAQREIAAGDVIHLRRK
jgi:BirA family transcriptional regulator, biotin operon repressor / biotin---[acetyl-CoA-carboxylase] ligase